MSRISSIEQAINARGYKLKRLLLSGHHGLGQSGADQRLLGSVRERWPDAEVRIHLHDTRGPGLANIIAALELGISHFDAAVAGLGGCPFAGHAAAAGNICTEDLVFMCEEMGIETGIDLEKLIECARLAEEVVGHSLPGKAMKGGSLAQYRHAHRRAVRSRPMSSSRPQRSGEPGSHEGVARHLPTIPDTACGRSG